MRLIIRRFKRQTDTDTTSEWERNFRYVSMGQHVGNKFVPFSDSVVESMINATVDILKNDPKIRNVTVEVNRIDYEELVEYPYIDFETVEELVEWISANTYNPDIGISIECNNVYMVYRRSEG